MNICFHFILLICILQVLSHSPRHESKNHKVARHGGKKLKTVNTSGLENRFKSLSHPRISRTRKLKSADPKQKNEHRVKKLAQKRRNGKKKHLKNHGSGLYGSVKDKAVSVGSSKFVIKRRKRPHRRMIQKSLAKKDQFKIRQDSKKRKRPDQKKNSPRHNRILTKNSAKFKNNNKRTGRRRGVKIRTKSTYKKTVPTDEHIIATNQKETLSTTKAVATTKYEPLEIVTSLSSKPFEENKRKQEAPTGRSDDVVTPKHEEEIKPVVTGATVILKEKPNAETIEPTKKEPRKIKGEKPKNSHQIHMESKIPTQEADNIKASSNQVTEMSQITTEDDYFKFFHQTETEITTTEKPKKEKTVREILEGIINDEEYRLYYTKDIYDSDIPNLCMKRRQIAQKLFDKGFDFSFFPKCDYNGLFKPKQCDLDSCWCVDVKTGQKVSGPCEPKRITFTQPLRGSKREQMDYERMMKRKKERARLREIQDKKAFAILKKTCFFLQENRCVVLATLLQGAPELPRKIVEAYTGTNKIPGSHGQDYQRAFEILKKLRLDTKGCEDIIYNLPFLQPYMERFSESCDATNELFWDIFTTDPFRATS